MMSPVRHSGAACVVGALAPYNHGVPLAGAGWNPDDQQFPTQMGQRQGFVRYAESLYDWIPACAGMTQFS
jgi:hypothetical protein